jgi:phage/plasmid-associated DNA primase
LKAAVEAATDERKEQLMQQLKCLRTYNNTPEITRTLELVREKLFAPSFVQQLDADPDILNVKDGVLLLKTGELDVHRPQYMCSKIAETDFMVSPQVERF